MKSEIDQEHQAIPHALPGERCKRHENLGWGRQIWAGMGWGECRHCEREKNDNKVINDVKYFDKFILSYYNKVSTIYCTDGSIITSNNSDNSDNIWIDVPRLFAHQPKAKLIIRIGLSFYGISHPEERSITYKTLLNQIQYMERYRYLDAFEKADYKCAYRILQEEYL